MLPDILVVTPAGSPVSLTPLAGSPQLNFKMGSIPGASQGVDINYNKSSPDGQENPFSPIGSPSSPCSSWEESMMQLSRDLQIICRSPDRYDMPVFPSTQGGGIAVPFAVTSSGPTSPTAVTTTGAVTMRAGAAAADVGKLLNVRHVQSEEKLREKLTYICRSPRRSRSSTSSTEGEASVKAGRAVRAAAAARRKSSNVLPFFRTSVDIGDHTIEDLSVLIEDHKLKVFSERKEEVNLSSRGELPAVVDLPHDVNPQKLICIVRDGALEVRESKKRCAPTSKVLGRQLSMSYTSTGLKAPDTLRQPCGGRHEPDQCPIVIEDDGSHLLKLVLRVPPGYKFNDLQIKTVDNQLIVTGRRGPQRSLSASFTPPAWNKENEENEDSFTKVFELPSSVDPFSITARLTDQHQLIIQATLSPRIRSNTL